MKIGGFFLTFLLSSLVFAQDANLANSIDWINLGHYKKNIIGQYGSQVDGPSFFISPHGKNSPEDELAATIAAFKGPNAQEKTCAFPARALFLNKKLGIPIDLKKCEKFQEFAKRMSVRSASLVFSSYYLNNPSSAFGHTFLRLNTAKGLSQSGEHHELLDQGVNYAAVMGTDNPIIYSIGGIIGIFKGTFTAIPYYYKVREYNDYETRDLWSYDLNLSDSELEMLVTHIWELGPTYYDYFYFTENCSYHMFTTLEAAAPRLKLTEKIPRLYVIPAQTVRALSEEPGFVTAVGFRPSTRTTFFYRLSLLSDAEKKELHELTQTEKVEILAPEISAVSKAKIYDTLLDYLEYTYPKDLVKNDTPSAKWKQKVLFARARLGIQSEKLEIPMPMHDRPDLGHPIGRITFAGGFESSQSVEKTYGLLGVRFALHDLLDSETGYPQNAQIDFVNLQGRYLKTPTESKIELERLTLFKVTSLSPWDEYNKNISFKVELGLLRQWDANCNACSVALFEAGPGFALGFFKNKVIGFGFAEGQVATSNELPKSGWRLGVGPTAGLLFNWTDNLKMIAQGKYKYYAFTNFSDHYEVHFDARWEFLKNVALDLSATAVPWNQWQTQAALMWYL